jgi:hypothetical protein
MGAGARILLGTLASSCHAPGLRAYQTGVHPQRSWFLNTSVCLKSEC